MAWMHPRCREGWKDDVGPHPPFAICFQKDIHQLDVACRKFLRAVVGPPSNIDWSRPWHEILHDWNGKVQSVTLEHGMKLWSHQSLASY